MHRLKSGHDNSRHRIWCLDDDDLYLQLSIIIKIIIISMNVLDGNLHNSTKVMDGSIESEIWVAIGKQTTQL